MKQAPTGRSLDLERLGQFAGHRLQASPASLQLSIHPLRGGLQAIAVARVTASTTLPGGHRKATSFVVKRVECVQSHEATVYAELLQPAAISLGPQFLGRDDLPDGSTYLYLEYVRATHTWPWRDVKLAALVLTELARLHETLPAHAVLVRPNLEYETELRVSAETTLDIFERTPLPGSSDAVRSARRSLRRVTAAVPAMRRVLLDNPRFGESLLHGDVHSRNIVVRASRHAVRAILLDWGRARLGSPLEDVSSWLQSLGYWEPEARRRHDWLLRQYLRARGNAEFLDRELRDLYWLAGACNALAGALRYHLALIANPGLPAWRRDEAMRAVHHHLRVIRRADFVWPA
jgi:hypothetical protein